MGGRDLATRLAFAVDAPYTGDVAGRGVVPRRHGRAVRRRAARRPDFAAPRPNIRVPDRCCSARHGGQRQRQPVRPAPGDGPADADVAGGHVRGRPRGRSGQPDALALRGDGGDGEGRARVVAAHRLDRPRARRPRGPARRSRAARSATAWSPAFQGRRPSSACTASTTSTSPAPATTSSPWDTALRASTSARRRPCRDRSPPRSGALATTRALAAAGYTPANGAVYDSNSDLAMSLRDVARLIKAQVGLQVAAVDYGDWDMHEGLATGRSTPRRAGCTTSSPSCRRRWPRSSPTSGRR